jgi:hypothetical protein
MTINNGEARTINWTSNLITTYDTPTGFTVSAGGVGTGDVTFEQSVGAPVADYSVTSFTGGSISYIDQGVAAVAEITEQAVVSWGSGVAEGSEDGWFTFSDDGTGVTVGPIPVRSTTAAIKTALNAADKYNGAVDTVAKIWPSSAVLTITFGAGVSNIGVVTIGGAAGNQITVSVTNISNG